MSARAPRRLGAVARAFAQLALLMLAAATPRPASAEGSAALLAKAAKARDEALRTLGKDRQERNEARAALNRRLQTAYARLAEVQSATERIGDEHGRLDERARNAELGARERERRSHRLQDALRMAAELPRGAPNEEVTAFTATVTAGIDARLTRLARRLTVSVEDREIIDRAGRPATARLIRIGGALALAAGRSEQETGLVRREGGHWLIDGRSLVGREARALAASAAGPLGALPIDVDGTVVRQSDTTSEAVGWLESGGAFVWPILAVGLLGLLLLVERVWYLRRQPELNPTTDRVRMALRYEGPGAAEAIVSAGASDLDRVLKAAVDNARAPRAEREAALEAALIAEESRLGRSLAVLGACAGIAPLLGLLGTVTGMISTFEVITQHGTGNPRLLSGGISVALITTQLGLLVAIPLILGHAWTSRAVERREAILEEARNTVLSVEPPAEEGGAP